MSNHAAEACSEGVGGRYVTTKPRFVPAWVTVLDQKMIYGELFISVFVWMANRDHRRRWLSGKKAEACLAKYGRPA